jgi:hypothetical protein
MQRKGIPRMGDRRGVPFAPGIPPPWGRSTVERGWIYRAIRNALETVPAPVRTRMK